MSNLIIENSCIKYYLDDKPNNIFNLLRKTKTSGCLQCFISISSNADRFDNDGGMIFYLHKETREQIAEKCHISLQTMEQYIGKLVKAGFIGKFTDCQRKYQLNPFIFGKGEWEDIKETRKIWFERYKSKKTNSFSDRPQFYIKCSDCDLIIKKTIYKEKLLNKKIICPKCKKCYITDDTLIKIKNL